MNTVCVSYKSLFILFITLSVLYYLFPLNIEKMSEINLYSNLKSQDLLQKIQELQDNLQNETINKQTCQLELQKQKQFGSEHKSNVQNKFLDKVYNPLTNPEVLYPGSYDSNNQYQMIGFFSDSLDQFPVFGRTKNYRNDKWEYYSINDSRNKIKIPFKTTNDNEMYDGDTIMIPQLSNNQLTFTKYEIEQIRYNPNINFY